MRRLGLIVLMAAVLTLTVASTALAGGGGYTPPNLGQYIVIPVAEGGMKCLLKQDYSQFCIMPPGYNMRCQVFKRGAGGVGYSMVDSTTVTVSYSIEGNTYSQNGATPKTNFWTYAPDFGWNLAMDTGTKGYGLSGTMAYNATTKAFEALKLPQTGYLDASPTTPNPYQDGIVTVKDLSGNVLVTQKFVMPASDEDSCQECHGGTGGADTDLAIVQKHDQLSGTNLATDGKANLCADCHADASIGKPGDGIRKPLSTAMHSFHANKFPKRPAYPVCYYCHPGPTAQCNRGAMAEHGKSCDNASCHGGLTTMGSTSRTPWSAGSLPRCDNCHSASLYGENVGKKMQDSVLLNSPDTNMNGKMLCQSCHGAQHAEWPASTRANDNQVPVALQNSTNPLGKDWCGICHSTGGVIPTSGSVHR